MERGGVPLHEIMDATRLQAEVFLPEREQYRAGLLLKIRLHVV